jgi:hypothetical protein
MIPVKAMNTWRNYKMRNRILTIDLDGVGWKSSFQQKRGTTRVSLKKDVAVGLAVRKGQATFGYLGRCLNSNRPVIIFYPDGKERDGELPDDRE